MAKMVLEHIRFFLIERTISKPATLVVAGWLLAGITLLIGTFFPIDVNPALGIYSTEWVLGIMLVLGGGASLLSTRQWKLESTAWRLELAGFTVCAAAWLLYTALVIFTNWQALFPIALGLAFVSACVQRVIEVRRNIKETRHNLSVFEEKQREGEL